MLLYMSVCHSLCCATVMCFVKLVLLKGIDHRDYVNKYFHRIFVISDPRYTAVPRRSGCVPHVHLHATGPRDLPKLESKKYILYPLIQRPQCAV